MVLQQMQQDMNQFMEIVALQLMHKLYLGLQVLEREENNDEKDNTIKYDNKFTHDSKWI
jgi:hypothetical protein